MSTLLSSPNSTWTPSSPSHKGGILLKPPTSFQSFASYDESTNPASKTSDNGSDLPSDSSNEGPVQPITPTATLRSPPTYPLTGSVSAGGPIGGGGHPHKALKIKFAPLPDPRAAGGGEGARRLSTGADLQFHTSLGPGGERSMQMHRAGQLPEGVEVGGPGGDSALADDDDSPPSDEEGFDQGEDGSKRRGSSILSGSWRGTKKLLKPLGLSSSSSSKQLNRTSSLESNGSGGSGGDGGPLSRTFSNISRSLGASSSLSSSSHAPPSPSGGRRASMATPAEAAAERQSRLLHSLSPSASRDLALAPSRSNERSSSPGGRLGDLSTSPRSPIGMRMINGRVYGSKGMDTMKKAEQAALRGPDFKEWGQAGLGSNSRAGDEEEDDGSGMGWVRRRREAKEKKDKEDKEAAEAAGAAAAEEDDPALTGLDSLLLSTSDFSSPLSPPTPSTAVPKTPTESNLLSTPPQFNLQPPSRKSTAESYSIGVGLDSAPTPRTEAAPHRISSITIPGNAHPPRSGPSTPTADKTSAFSFTPMASTAMGGAGGSANASVKPLAIGGGGGVKSSSVGPWGEIERTEESDSDDDDEEEEEDDGEERDEDEDEEDTDPEEERLNEEARKTAVSAGVEVLSRHKSFENEETLPSSS